MADSQLDSIVKGSPMPDTEMRSPPIGTSGIGVLKPGDPLNHTPSSPSMIYLNMLVLEASLRAQYLELRTRRRKHTFFLGLLSLWVGAFGYALFFAPREDGIGVGGSIYWVVDMFEKVCFISGIITGLLVWATGIWERGIRWPRRWFGVSNRGLRGFNCKLVITKRSWWVEIFSTIAFFFTYGAFSSTSGQYRHVEPSILREVDKELNLTKREHPTLPYLHIDEEKQDHEEDIAPGGDYVKLLLLPKPFSPTFRENWELYRSDYWERENERRALIRAKLKQRDRDLAKKQSPWFWWLPWSRVETRSVHPDSERALHAHRHPTVREHKRPRRGSVRRGSVSTNSSRSPTPTVETEEEAAIRRASMTSTGSQKRTRRHGSTASRSSKRPGIDTRSLTPDFPSPLAKESNLDSVDSGSGKEGSGRSLRNKPSRTLSSS